MLIFCSQLVGSSDSEAVYGLLRSVYISKYGDDFPVIKKTPNGKPYFPDRPDVHFSLSHTKTHVLCAISDMPVGCDIEANSREISQRGRSFFCTPEELSMFEALDLWVLKESYIKLFGLTFADLRRQVFLREGNNIILPDPDVTARLYSVDGLRIGLCGFEVDFPDCVEFVH